MTGRARKAAWWLVVPVRHGISLRLLVVLAMLSTITSALLGLGSAAWADDADGTGGSSSTVDDGSGGGAGGDLGDEGDGQGSTGEDGAGGSQPEPEADSGDEGDGRGSTGEDRPGVEEEQDAQEGNEEEEEEESAEEEFERLVQEQREADSLNRGVLSAFDVRDEDGAPVSAYRVYADTGDWDDWDLKLQNFLVQLCFTIIVWVISFTCWLIAWALSFSLAALLFRPVLSIANSLHNSVLVEMGLPGLFLAIAAVTAGWQWMFGSRARGWGEAAAALLISALALGALASPPDLLLSERDGVVGKVQDLAVEVAGLIVHPAEPPDPDLMQTPQDWEEHERQQELDRTPGLPGEGAEVSRPITDALVEAFIARPSQLLSYGTTFQGSCAASFRDMQVRQRVFEDELDKRLSPDDPVSGFVEDTLRSIPGIGGYLGDWFTSRGEVLAGEDLWFKMNVEDEWQEILDRGPIEDFEEECLDNLESAKRASWDKVGGAFFALVAAIIAALFVLLLVGAFLSAQFWLAIEAILAKLALVIGVLPGIGRAWLVARATEIVRRLLLMLVSIGALAVFVHIITVLVNAPEEDIPGGITTRFVVIDIVCISGFVFRSRLTQVAGNLARLGTGGPNGRTSATSSSGMGVGLASGGGGGRAAWLAAGLLSGGSSLAARSALRRGPVRLAKNSTAAVGRTRSTVGHGLQRAAQGASVARRAVFSQDGRTQLRRRVKDVAGKVGTGPSPHMPADVTALRARMTRLRAESDRRATAVARPAGRFWSPPGARPVRRGGGQPAPALRSDARATSGRATAAAADPRRPGRAGTPVVSPKAAQMRRQADRIHARRTSSSSPESPLGGAAGGTGRGGSPASTPSVQNSRLSPRAAGRRGGRGTGGQGRKS